MKNNHNIIITHNKKTDANRVYKIILKDFINTEAFSMQSDITDSKVVLFITNSYYAYIMKDLSLSGG